MKETKYDSGRASTAAPCSEWVEFDQDKWGEQRLPTEKRYVLVMLPAVGSLPPIVAVGYMKFAAGSKKSPLFITPGVGGIPSHWNDCLGDDFSAPMWKGKQIPNTDVNATNGGSAE